MSPESHVEDKSMANFVFNFSNTTINCTSMNCTIESTPVYYDATPYIVLSIIINAFGLVGNALVPEV